ncbi:hypothetical protein Misp06_00106 [Microbulbifer sp. NBRC 101763]|uniref:DUF4124 domain-containing protein n=1 Tax=unclassified Microbulbifer TaxID=2619833 RepID=UPI003096D64F
MKYAYMLAVLLLVGVGLSMILPDPEGKPIMSPSDWLPDQKTIDNVRYQGQRALHTVTSTSQQSAKQLESFVKSSGLISPVQSETPATEVFTWQDREGNWHFSDSVPEGLDTSIRIHRVKPINTVPGTQVSANEEPPHAQATPPQESAGADSRISQLLKEVQALQEKSLQRQQALDNL